MKAKKVIGKVAKTGYDAAKIAFQLETGDLRGINESILDAAKTWGGKKNALQRFENKADKKLSKNRFYRVGKAAANLYFDQKSGNYTGAYNDSVQVARQVLGKKHSSAVNALDRNVQKYVMPAAQNVQDVYQYQKAVRAMPTTVKKAYSTPSVRNTAVLGFKSAGAVKKHQKVMNLVNKLNRR